VTRAGRLAFLLCLGLAACSSEPPKDPNARGAVEIYREKGIRYMELGEYEYALQDLRHAVDLNEKDSESHSSLAVLYGRMNRPDMAEKHFKRAMSLDENKEGVANNYGRFLCAQGKHEQAMAQFKQIIASQTYKLPWLALTNAGLCARNAGRRDEAEEYLRGALDVAPDFPPALLEMAKLSLEKGQLMSARGFLQRYEGVATLSPEALSLGVQVEQALGNRQAAEEYRKRLRSGNFPSAPDSSRDRDGLPAH
jgi:type IV pilus assembly protein PilF